MPTISKIEKCDLRARSDDTLVAELPPSICRYIGRVVFKFSILEYQLNQLAYALAGVDRRIGRLAVRSPRATEVIDMVNDLMDAREMNAERLRADLTTSVQQAQSDRDLLAHGVWTKLANGKFQVVSMRGKVPIRLGGATSAKRLQHPVGILVTAEMFQHLVASIEAATKLVDQHFRGVLGELQITPEKLRARRLAADDTPATKGKR